MSILRLDSCGGGGRFLSPLLQITKSRGKIASTAKWSLYYCLAFLSIASFVGVFAPLPAMADDSINISVDPDVSLIKHGNLYKTTVGVTVGAEEPYGFDISMQAADSSLSNSTDKSHKIESTQSATPVELGANQWGYALDSNAGKFSKIPNSSESVTNIVDVTKDNLSGCKSVKFCTKRVTYAANIDAAKLSAGNYSTSITYTATAKAAPAPTPIPPAPEPPKPAVVSSNCVSGSYLNDCQVDLDDNMIPVKYDGDSVVALANPESAYGEWYDYNNGKWANAITVSKDALSKYKGQTRVVEKRDILGYWVYIPRYAYNVLRRDGTDRPVSKQNFDIMFEKASDPKHYPAACSITNMDYQSCVYNHSYDRNSSNGSTWATHPAFTFGSSELNGIWFSKYTMKEGRHSYGSDDPPIMTPDGSDIYDSIDNFYEKAGGVGAHDYNNCSNGCRYDSSHNLNSFISNMANNSDWGAMSYLETSKYTSRNNYGVDLGNDSHVVAAVYSNDLSEFEISYYHVSPPYINTYNIANVSSCTFDTCGGQALYETDGWDGSSVSFVDNDNKWFTRSGLFSTSATGKYSYSSTGEETYVVLKNK